MKQDNPFAKLGALDQKLYQETTPKPTPSQEIETEKQEFQNSSKQVNQKTSKPENINTSIPEIQKTSNPEFQKTTIPEKRASGTRKFYTKATYRLSEEALDALSDAKKILKRQHKLKVDLEEIVEAAVIEAYRELTEKGEKSFLVTKYSGNPANQNS